MSVKRVCVVGAGNWGNNHIRTLNELGSLSGIVDSNPDVLDKFSEKFSGVKTFLQLDNALLEKDFQGFIVATPADTHYEIAKKIIETEKHILVEKPLALNVKDAEELEKLANKNNVNLMVGHVLLFHPAITKIKEIISKYFSIHMNSSLRDIYLYILSYF